MKLILSAFLLYACGFCERNYIAEQLLNYSLHHQHDTPILTSSHGAAMKKRVSLTVGSQGPVLLQDTFLLDELAHFSRERIPERVVHAKGSGAFGYFEVTQDITKYSLASVFSEIGKRTKIAARFSGTLKELGGADTTREPHGFAIKFYTEEGIWDIVGLDLPNFFVRDAMHFSSLVHTLKRNPVTNLPDVDMYWDFITLRPEALCSTMYLFSDIGLPECYRHMKGYSIHAFKLVNNIGMAHYARFVMTPNQGARTMTDERAASLRGSDPDYCQRDLYNSIAGGNFPSWNISIQLMTGIQAQEYPWNPFDITKAWPLEDFPLLPIGIMTLNSNPENYFAQVEQIAFSPGNLIPGIEPSPDRVLHARMFAYPDAQRYRLGTNYQQLPVNCPLRVNNYQRAGAQLFFHQGGAPNYYPNTFSGPEVVPQVADYPHAFKGLVARYDLEYEDNYSESTRLWLRMKPDEQERLVNRFAMQFVLIVSDDVRNRTITLLKKVHSVFGYEVHKKLLELQKGV